MFYGIFIFVCGSIGFDHALHLALFLLERYFAVFSLDIQSHDKNLCFVVCSQVCVFVVR